MVSGINKNTKGLGIILFIGFIFGYVIPYFIADTYGGINKDEVFNSVYKNFDTTYKTYKTKPQNQSADILADSDNIQRYYDAGVHNKSIDSLIACIGKGSLSLIYYKDTITKTDSAHFPLIYFKQTIEKLDAAKINLNTIPGIKIYGFIDSKTSLIMPISLTALLIICFVIISVKPRINKMHFTLIFSVVGIIYIFPQILRANPSLGGWQGRVIYSVFNDDVNRVMFIYNLALNIVTIALLVLIWLKCDCYATENQKKYTSDYSLNNIIDTLTAIKGNYSTWQFFSVTLFAVFGLQLYSLYGNVFIDGDNRYLFQAVFFNFLYLLTWLIGSVPLYLEFRTWRSFKDKLLFDTEAESKMTVNGINVAELRKIIPDYEIASSLNHGITVALSAISFFLPLIKVLRK